MIWRCSRRRSRARAARLRRVRGRLAPRRACSRSDRGPAGALSTGSGSRISPTSTSASRREARSRRSEPSPGWRRRRPDLVCVTGDLVSHPRGVPLLVGCWAPLERPFVVLGNHDVAVTRDPFSRAAELDGLAEVAVLLRDEAAIVERRRAANPARRHRRRRATREDARVRGSSRTPRPTSGSCSATSPGSRAGSRTAPSTSCSPGTCTPVRSCCRTRAGG